MSSVCSLQSVDTRFTLELKCNCLCRSCRPSKFPLRYLSHNKINSLHFIALKTFGVPVQLGFFFPQKRWEHWISQRKWLWQWLTAVLRSVIGWSCWPYLSQLPVSVNGVARRAKWEGSGEDATVIQEKTAHCSWDVEEVWPPRCRLWQLDFSTQWRKPGYADQ